MKDYNNIVSLWVRGFTMEKENKADLCSVLVKLGLAVMSVAYPQTGSQASLASAGVDVVLSVVKSVGLLKGEKDDSIDGQLKECIANVLARIQGGRLLFLVNLNMKSIQGIRLVTGITQPEDI